MDIKIIGIGAAGNKAALRAVSAGVVTEDDVLLLNTTSQDIAATSKKRAVIFNKDSTGGCGKERERSKELLVKALQDGYLVNDLNKLISPGNLVVIVASTEGGTGSGSAPTLAGYIDEVIGTRPQLIAFTGTENDLRGLQNTADFFKDCATICPNCTIQAISNKRFLADANDNQLSAEIMANDEFVRRIKVLSGSILKDSDQNIDAMDHRKVVTTPGYMSIITYTTQDTIESVEQFNKICTNMMAASKSLPTSGNKITRLAVIATINDYEKDNIDWSFSKIKSTFGVVGEIYTHVQAPIDTTRQIIVIEAGLEMPIDFVMSTYERFKERADKMNAGNNSDFLTRMSQINTGGASSLDFDSASREHTSKPSDFFSKLTGEKTPNKEGFKNTSSSDDVIDNV